VLKQRLLTAAVLVPLVIWAILSASQQVIAAILTTIVILGGREWGRLLGLEGLAKQFLFAVALLPAITFIWAFFPWESTQLLAGLAVAALWWCLSIWLVLRFPSVALLNNRGFKGLAGFLVLLPFWGAMLALHGHGEQGPHYLLYLLVLIWVADSAAYFAGRRWGRYKLAPRVSPGKTIEGLYGALAGGAVWGVVGVYWLEPDTALLFILLSMVTVLFSVLGDMVESMFKRQAGIKDSGQLLPGHAGKLDRIDSLTATAPVFVLGLILMENGI